MFVFRRPSVGSEEFLDQNCGISQFEVDKNDALLYNLYISDYLFFGRAFRFL